MRKRNILLSLSLFALGVAVVLLVKTKAEESEIIAPSAPAEAGAASTTDSRTATWPKSIEPESPSPIKAASNFVAKASVRNREDARRAFANLPTELLLVSAQAEELAVLWDDLQEVRKQFEMGLAKVSLMPNGGLQVEIPPYPAAGQRLKGLFEKEASAILGEPKASHVVAALESDLIAAFRGFGATRQVIQIKPVNRTYGNATYQISDSRIFEYSPITGAPHGDTGPLELNSTLTQPLDVIREGALSYLVPLLLQQSTHNAPHE